MRAAESRKVCCLVVSPRRDGNSMSLASAFANGAEAAGHDVDVCFLADYMDHFLRDCGTCRNENSVCSLDDNYGELLLQHILPADAIVIASPIYWYALPAQMKATFDRVACYSSAKFPGSEDVIRSLKNKRYILLLASEESNPGMSTGIIQQVSDFARYTSSHLVAVLNGVGNTRGEVSRDPRQPLEKARKLGREVFDLKAVTLKIDSSRPTAVWPVE